MRSIEPSLIDAVAERGARLPPAISLRAGQAARFFNANSALVIGSVARGEDDDLSDLDLLLLSASERSPSDFVRAEEGASDRRPLSVIVYSPTRFAEMWEEGNLFVCHALVEGALIADDGTLASLAARGFSLKSDFRDDIAHQVRQLSWFRDARRFNGVFLYALARLFSIYKNLVFFALAQHGCPIFSRRRAFARFYEFYPALSHLAAPLEALYACYVVAIKGPLLPLRIATSGPDALLTGYIAMLDELAAAVP